MYILVHIYVICILVHIYVTYIYIGSQFEDVNS